MLVIIKLSIISAFHSYQDDVRPIEKWGMLYNEQNIQNDNNDVIEENSPKAQNLFTVSTSHSLDDIPEIEKVVENTPKDNKIVSLDNVNSINSLSEDSTRKSLTSSNGTHSLINIA